MNSARLAGSAHAKSIALMKFLAGVANRLGVGHAVYVVGGAVRNFILDAPIKDVDIVIDSVALKGKDSEWFAKKLQQAIPTGSNLTTNQYGVAILTIKGSWVLDGEDLRDEVIEIANARKESYGGEAGKGFKPHMVEPATIEEDVVRREFTFNTLMFRLLDLTHGPEKAEIIDLTGCGLKDLNDGVMACPRDPDIVFADDPTRLMRVIKFVAKYGFKIPPDLAASIRRNAPKMKQAPWEAIGTLLVENVLRETSTVKKSLQLMQSLGLLDVVSEIVRASKPFQSYLAGVSQDLAVLLLLDMMDLGIGEAFKTPISFLDRSQHARLREISVDMTPEQAADFVQKLRVPPIDNMALIEEYKLQPRDRGILSQVAREVLLNDPEMAWSLSSLQVRVETALEVRLSQEGKLASHLRVARVFREATDDPEEAPGRVKYPRTFHLPWSPGATDDDKILDDVAHFEGKIVVVTEKLDGENCTIGRNYSHARSTDSANHPSRDWVKQFAAGFQFDIPDGWRLCGENLFAKHSIGYDALPSYFMLFSIWDNTNTCLSWDDTVEYAAMLGVHHVPVLYKGPWDEEKIRKIFDGNSSVGGTAEGYVVRNAGSFPYSAFGRNIAKYVRKGHVQTDTHWMQQAIKPNKLIKQASQWKEVSDEGDPYWLLTLPDTQYVFYPENREVNWLRGDDWGWVADVENIQQADQRAKAHHVKYLQEKKLEVKQEVRELSLREQIQELANDYRHEKSPSATRYRFILQQAQDLGLVDNALRLKLNRLNKEFGLDSENDGERMARGLELILQHSKHESLRTASSHRVALRKITDDTEIKFDGEYIKTAPVKALQMEEAFTVNTLEGDEIKGKEGDYLCQGPAGERWPVDQKIFQDTYKKKEAFLRVASFEKQAAVGGAPGVGLFFPLPENLGAQFPKKSEDKSPAHATFLYVGSVPPERKKEFLALVRGFFDRFDRGPVKAVLGAPDCFQNSDFKVVFTPVRFSCDMGRVRQELWEKLLAAGFVVEDSHQMYSPHCTIEYLEDPRQEWKGVAPSGTWELSGVEVWGLGKKEEISFGKKYAPVAHPPAENPARAGALEKKRIARAQLRARWGSLLG